MRAKPKRVFGLVVVLLLGVSSAASAVVGLVVHGRQKLARPLDFGSAELPPGDRRVRVPFEVRFRDPPTVTTSAEGPEPIAASVRQVSPRMFELAVDRPGPRALGFSWIASSAAPACSEVPMMDFGLHAIPIDLAGERAIARVTGWRAGRPTEIALETTGELSDAGAVTASVLARVADVLAGRNGPYASRTLNRLLRSVVDPFPHCPVDPWRLDPDAWQLRREPGRIVLSLAEPAADAPALDAVVERIAALIRGADAFDMFPHNNQVIDFLDDVAGEIAVDDLTVVHFDSHSDFFVYADPADYVSSEHLGEFLNTLIARGNVREVYWVMPDWTREPEAAEIFWDEKLSADMDDGPDAYVNGPRVLELWVDLAKREIRFEAPAAPASSLRRVRFHKLTLDELPAFAGDERIYLEIDADYFSNTGHDTTLNTGENPSEPELRALLLRAFTRLAERGVHPRLVSVAMSPSYTADEDRRALSLAFEQAAAAAGLKDRLVGYRHVYSDGIGESSRNVRRQGRLYELLYALGAVDHRQSAPDDRTPIRPAADDAAGQAELAAVRAEAARLGIADLDRLLLQLDRLDGANDRFIEPAYVDEEIARGVAAPLLDAAGGD